MSGRIQCCVPFCRRTRKAGPYSEWICAIHWPMVSKRTKQRRRLADRASKRADSRFNVKVAARTGGVWTVVEWNRVKAAHRLRIQLWERCKREAIESAAGL